MAGKMRLGLRVSQMGKSLQKGHCGSRGPKPEKALRADRLWTGSGAETSQGQGKQEVSAGRTDKQPPHLGQHTDSSRGKREPAAADDQSHRARVPLEPSLKGKWSPKFSRLGFHPMLRIPRLMELRPQLGMLSEEGPQRADCPAKNGAPAQPCPQEAEGLVSCHDQKVGTELASASQDS